MKAKLVIFLCVSALALSGCGKKGAGDVYVSASPRSYAYHSDERCFALRRSTYPVEKVSRKEAERRGRRPCGICCK